MTDRQEYKTTEEKEVKARSQEKAIGAESRGLAIITQILKRKLLVIGIPVAAIVIALTLILINSSREKKQDNAALAYETSQSFDEFMDVYKKYPNSSYGAYSLERAAKLSLRNGDNITARDLAQEFLKKYPQNNLGIYVKTYVPISLENEGKYDEAISACKEILENDPQMDLVSDSLNMRIGFCYEMKGEYDDAKSYYTKIASRSGLTGQPIEGVPSVWSSEAAARLRDIEKKEKTATKEQRDEVITEPR